MDPKCDKWWFELPASHRPTNQEGLLALSCLQINGFETFWVLCPEFEFYFVVEVQDRLNLSLHYLIHLKVGGSVVWRKFSALPLRFWAMMFLTVFMSASSLSLGNLLMNYLLRSTNHTDSLWVWKYYGTAARATYTLQLGWVQVDGPGAFLVAHICFTWSLVLRRV